MTVLGSLVARGRTSEVFSFGVDSVVKVPRPGVPGHWAGIEAGIADSVHRTGLPTPEVRDVVEIDGRESIVFEWIDGPSMWQQLLDSPAETPQLTRQMIEVQRAINQMVAPPGVPTMESRICAKIEEAELLSRDERQRAFSLTRSLPSGTSLCHGDLHPGNILMGASGPVVIDWFDAAAGFSRADLVRTSLLIRPQMNGTVPAHLPGASVSLLHDLHQIYLEQVLAGCGAEVAELLLWERVLAAGRLAEQSEADQQELLMLWRSDEPTNGRTPLAQALASMGMA